MKIFFLLLTYLLATCPENEYCLECEPKNNDEIEGICKTC